MSYDFWMATDNGDVDPDGIAIELPEGLAATGGRTAVLGRNRSLTFANYTSNVSPMWSLAIARTWPDGPDDAPPLRDLHGLRGGEVYEIVHAAMQDMLDHPEVYEPLNPANGWGDYEGATAYLGSIAAMCQAYPDAKLEFST